MQTHDWVLENKHGFVVTCYFPWRICVPFLALSIVLLHVVFVFGIQPTVLQLHTWLNGIMNSLIIIPSLYYAWTDWLWWMVVQTMCNVNAVVWASLFVLLLYALWACLVVTIMEVNMIVALCIMKRWCLSQMLYYPTNSLCFCYSSKYWNIEYLSHECNLQSTQMFSWSGFCFLGFFFWLMWSKC